MSNCVKMKSFSMSKWLKIMSKSFKVCAGICIAVVGITGLSVMGTATEYLPESEPGSGSSSIGDVGSSGSSSEFSGVNDPVYSGIFPDAGAPEIYVPDGSKQFTPTPENDWEPTNIIANIEEYEKQIVYKERSSIFDALMFCAGGILFLYSLAIILAYGLDRVNIIPRFSFIRIVTFGKYDLAGWPAKSMVLRTSVMICFGILLSTGLAKRLLTLLYAMLLKFIIM